MAVFVNCTVEGESVICNGTTYTIPEERLTYHDKFFWIYLAIYVVLVLAAGLFSGLTMGLLSLDLMTLKILKDGGTTREQRYASRILPIVKRHHLLLVTLLLANAGAVEAMPIFLDRVSDPIIAICVSVTAVLIFGEVIPQALCTRFGLAIGYTLAPLVYILMGLFFIISWPLSKVLDCLLGSSHSTFFRRAQLKVLVDLHGPGDDEVGDEEHLTTDEVLIIKGALDLKGKRAHDAMVKIDSVFMLSSDSCMDQDTMTQILTEGHSRIPVYEGNRSNIIALLLMKTLIKLDPDDAIPVQSLLQDPQYFRKILFVKENIPLYDLINLFQTGKGHLAVVKKAFGESRYRGVDIRTDDEAPLLGESEDVQDNDGPEEDKIVGIITLEDVLEELLQEEIMDETDVHDDIRRRIQVARAKALRTKPNICETGSSDQSNVPVCCSVPVFPISQCELPNLLRSQSHPSQSQQHLQVNQRIRGHSSDDLNVDVAIATRQQSDDAPLLGQSEVLA